VETGRPSQGAGRPSASAPARRPIGIPAAGRPGFLRRRKPAQGPWDGPGRAASDDGL